LVTKTQPFVPFSGTKAIKKTSQRIKNFTQQKYSLNDQQSDDGRVRELTKFANKQKREQVFGLPNEGPNEVHTKSAILEKRLHF
jgi:hypothetical protein